VVKKRKGDGEKGKRGDFERDEQTEYNNPSTSVHLLLEELKKV